MTIAPPPALRIEDTHRADPQIRAGQIDVDHLAPRRRLGLRDRSESHDARVVDQHGDRAEGVLGGGHRRRPVPVARDIEAGEDRVIAELVGKRSPFLLEYVRDHDVRALGDEATRVAGTHSTGTARDDHCPIIETFHDWSGSHDVDRDVDVPACGLGIGTRLVCGVHQGLGDLALHPGQADVEASLEEVLAAGAAKVHFGVNGRISREAGLHFGGRHPHRTHEAGGPTSGEQLLRIGTVARLAGDESLMSKRPSGLRDAPSRPPVVCALPVYSTFSRVVVMMGSGQDALPRAVFKAAVHHSRSSIIAPAGASNSASPASTSPPW